MHPTCTRPTPDGHKSLIRCQECEILICKLIHPLIFSIKSHSFNHLTKFHNQMIHGESMLWYFSLGYRDTMAFLRGTMLHQTAFLAMHRMRKPIFYPTSDYHCQTDYRPVDYSMSFVLIPHDLPYTLSSSLFIHCTRRKNLSPPPQRLSINRSIILQFTLPTPRTDMIPQSLSHRAGRSAPITSTHLLSHLNSFHYLSNWVSCNVMSLR